MSQLKQFPLPDVGEGLTEAEILTWHVAPGDEVEVNQIIVEIETAKAAVELPSPWAGVVSQLHAKPGETVNVGTPILTIDLDPSGATEAPPRPTGTEADETKGKIGEEMPGGRIATLVGYGPRSGAATRRPRKPPPGVSSDPVRVSSVPVRELHVPEQESRVPDRDPRDSARDSRVPAPESRVTAPRPRQPEERPAAAGPDGNGVVTAAPGYVPLAKPPVRKLAKELGVDLRALTGSGPSGVITREDVHRAATAPVPEPVAASPGRPAYDPAKREQRIPIRGVRKAMAAAMV